MPGVKYWNTHGGAGQDLFVISSPSLRPGFGDVDGTRTEMLFSFDIILQCLPVLRVRVRVLFGGSSESASSVATEYAQSLVPPLLWASKMDSHFPPTVHNLPSVGWTKRSQLST